MNTMKKYLACTFLALAAAFFAFSACASAAVKYPKKVICHMHSDFGMDGFDISCTDYQKISGIKSSNPSVADIKNYSFGSSKTTIQYSGKKADKSKTTYGGTIDLYLHGAGSTTISYKIGSTTYKTVVTVVKDRYVNPLKTLTITNVSKGRNIASLAKKTYEVKCKLSKAVTNAKIKVAANPGWKITGISVNSMEPYELNTEKKPVASATLIVPKLTKQSTLSITLKNTKTGEDGVYVSYQF